MLKLKKPIILRILAYEIVHCLLVEEALLTRARLRDRSYELGEGEGEKSFFMMRLLVRKETLRCYYTAREKPKSRPAAALKKGALDDVLEEKSVKKKRLKTRERRRRFYNFEFSSQLLAKVKNLGIKPGIYGRVEAASHLHGSLGQGGGIKLGRVPRRGEKCIVVHLAVKKTFFLGHKCL